MSDTLPLHRISNMRHLDVKESLKRIISMEHLHLWSDGNGPEYEFYRKQPSTTRSFKESWQLRSGCVRSEKARSGL